MWAATSLQKNLCVLFLTSALVTSLFMIKSRGNGQETANKTRNKELASSSSNHTQSIREDGGSVIHILGLFELTTKWGKRPKGLSELAAAELAIKHVNSLKVLPSHRLKLIANDTMCDPGVGIDRFFHAIYSRKTILMLLGSSCSNVTESLAHVVPYWNIVQVSFGSTSPTLSDRKKFPLFFRTIAPDSSHNHAKVKFVKHFGWRVVATFCQSENEFLLPLNGLIKDFEDENITCVTTITFSLDNFKEQLKLLKDSDIRIVVAAISSQVAALIFCEVYRLGMYGVDYVWILQDRGEFWRNSKSCSFSELKQATEGVILVSDYNVVSDNTSTVSGLNNELFERELNVPKDFISEYATLTYDAVWALALSLKQSDALSSKEFNYNRNDIVCEIVRRMSALNFVGISGPLKFIGADRVGSSALRQLQDGQLRNIAVFDANLGELDFQCGTCVPVAWWNKQTPIAQRILKLSQVAIPKTVFFLVVFVAAMGILVSICALYFNLRFRRIRTVKLSSPVLNNVAVIGCILVYIAVILMGFDTFTIDKYVNELCTVRVYLLSSGVSLSFGSMFAKTYRVHRIFANPIPPSKFTDKLLKDRQLIALILIPLVIDAIIVALWIMIDPMQRQLYNLTLEINSQDRGVVYQPQVQICKSQNTNGWFVAIYGYKGLIVIMGVFMAWETRHVKVQALNDSQYIGICVYSAVFSAIITVLTSFINEYVVFIYLLRTISILTATTLTLILMFLPKVKSVFGRHSSQDPVMQSMGLKIEYNTRRFINNDPREQILRLEIQNKVYRCELAALDLEIAKLEEMLARQKDEVFTVYNPKPEIYSTTSSHNNLSCHSKHLVVLEELRHFFSHRKVCPKDFLQLELKHKSNPDFQRNDSGIKTLTRAKSEFDLCKNPDFSVMNR